MIGAREFNEVLSGQFGLQVRVELRETDQGHVFTVKPDGVGVTRGFISTFTIGWQSLSSRCNLDNYAAGLAEAMRDAETSKKAALNSLIEGVESEGAEVSMNVSAGSLSPASPDSWPAEWSDFAINTYRGHLDFDPTDDDSVRARVLPWVVRFFGIHIALMPLENNDEDDFPSQEEEGAPYEATIKRYERSKANRDACLDHYGAACLVCGMDFAERYGAIGDGYIHVHHLEPLSMMAGSYVVDPKTDLVPLCPNCHAMAHRRKPPYSVEEIRTFLRPDGAEA